MGDGDATTIRKLDRELGEHDARLDGLEKKVDHIDEKMDDQHKTVMGAIQKLNDAHSEQKGKDRVVNAGIGLVAAGFVSLMFRKFGGG